MKEKIKVFVADDQIGYPRWINNYILVDNQQDADIIFFTGGEDVTPALYHNKKDPLTFNNVTRDLQEVKCFIDARVDQLCIGICRGSQFLCVVNGGKLVQHSTGHAGCTHELSYVGPEEYNSGLEGVLTTSTHHQMAYPYELPKEHYDVLCVSKEHLSHIYRGEVNSEVIRVKGEPEIVLYHRPNKPVCLGIQGHPEMMLDTSAFCIALNKLICKLLNKPE